jgi:hypothetical protein
VDAASGTTRHEWYQLRLLTVHFFRRFFDNELLSPGADPYAVVVRALSILASPGMVIALYLMPRYVNLQFQAPYLMDLARRMDQMLFFTISMAITGFVAALEWDALFPDRIDFVIMTPLPVRQRTAFLAKIASLIGFQLLFITAINLIPSVLFPLVAAPSGYSVLPFRFLFVNAAGLFAGSATIFLTAMALQGILMNLLPARWFRAASSVAQFLIMALMITFLLLYPKAGQLLKPGQTMSTLRLYPPAWFVALSEEWAGKSNPFALELAHRGLLAFTWSLVLAAIFYMVAYQRHVRSSLETMNIETGGSWIGRARDWAFAHTFFAHPVERGTALFVWNTLFRSPAHKLVFSAYMGVAAALVVWEMVTLLAKRSYSILFQPIPELLCIPLVLSFLLLSSLRVVFARPSELRANFVFRVTEREDSVVALRAASKVMLILGILPVTILPLPLHAWLWGWPTAAIHCAYTLLLGLILRATFTMNFRKIPFTCTFAPAGAGAVAWGTVYFFVFTTYAYSMARLEKWALPQPQRMTRCFAALVAVLLVVEYVRRALLTEEKRLTFQDTVEPVITTLGLEA